MIIEKRFESATSAKMKLKRKKVISTVVYNFDFRYWLITRKNSS